MILGSSRIGFIYVNVRLIFIHLIRALCLTFFSFDALLQIVVMEIHIAHFYRSPLHKESMIVNLQASLEITANYTYLNASA